MSILPRFFQRRHQGNKNADAKQKSHDAKRPARANDKAVADKHLDPYKDKDEP